MAFFSYMDIVDFRQPFSLVDIFEAIKVSKDGLLLWARRTARAFLIKDP
jgi:hypothetical protein